MAERKAAIVARAAPREWPGNEEIKRRQIEALKVGSRTPISRDSQEGRQEEKLHGFGNSVARPNPAVPKRSVLRSRTTTFASL